MTYNLLIFGEKGGGGIFLSMKNGWTYGKKIVWNTKMNWNLVMGFCLLALVPFPGADAETEYFPGEFKFSLKLKIQKGYWKG